MRTLEQVYCERHSCTPAQFRRRLFAHGLYPHARPFAWLIRLLHRRFFTADDALVRLVAEASTMRIVREEVRDYFWDSENRGWLRRVVNIRVSGQRVKNLAREYLPESELSFRNALPRCDPSATPAGSPPAAG